MTQMTAMKKREDWRANAKTMDGLRRRYSSMHPLIFQRSVERATDGGDAFDILEGVPTTFPVVWDDRERRWVTLTNMWLEPGNE